jgi:hypothetical protein
MSPQMDYNYMQSELLRVLNPRLHLTRPREENPETKLGRKLQKFFSERPSFFETAWSLSSDEKDLLPDADDTQVRLMSSCCSWLISIRKKLPKLTPEVQL